MKKYSKLEKGHTLKYDLSDSIKLLEEAIQKINQARSEISKIDDLDMSELEEGSVLIDRYYGNIVRGEIFKRRKKKGYIPNTSAIVPNKGDC